MYDHSPDHEMVWWAIEHGWGSERFDPRATNPPSTRRQPVGDSVARKTRHSHGAIERSWHDFRLAGRKTMHLKERT
jgi:hypothetical protein